jgi:hypothetical protein
MVQKQNQDRRAAFRVWHPSTLSEDVRRSKRSCINSYVGFLRRSPVLMFLTFGARRGLAGTLPKLPTGSGSSSRKNNNGDDKSLMKVLPTKAVDDNLIHYYLLLSLQGFSTRFFNLITCLPGQVQAVCKLMLL